MTNKIEFDELSEFSKDVKKFLKKYRTLHDDLEVVKLDLSDEPSESPPFSYEINNLGIKTFVGTSARVFPTKEYKPIDVLNAVLLKIKNNTVSLKFKHEWKGFSANNTLVFKNNNKLLEINSDYTIFCLGGASWKVTGSNGTWINYFAKKIKA